MSITLPITSRTGSDDNDFADVYANDAQLVTEIDARDSTYCTIYQASGAVNNGTGTALSILGTSASATGMLASGASLISASAPASPLIAGLAFYFDDADYSVSSKTQKLRIRAQFHNNATAYAGTATIGLYPVTVAGGNQVLSMTLGTVISGSTVAIAAPATSTVSQGNSGDFTVPADGQYALGVVLSTGISTNGAGLISAQLQTRWV